MPFFLTEEDETILHLKDLRDENRIIYEKLRLVPPQRHETRRKMDECDTLTQTLEQTLKEKSVEDDHTPTKKIDQAKLSFRVSSLFQEEEAELSQFSSCDCQMPTNG